MLAYTVRTLFGLLSVVGLRLPLSTATADVCVYTELAWAQVADARVGCQPPPVGHRWTITFREGEPGP